MAVHPHGRGDNAPSKVQDSIPYGSPPRAWGQCGTGIDTQDAARFTPTGVGTMCSPERRRGRATVHPHGRGDNGPSGTVYGPPGGSPPRAWGQCSASFARIPQTRFTSTGVGTMGRRARRGSGAAVHPHGRGDNGGRGILRHQNAGSPPRAWGQSTRKARPLPDGRFTPTGVGTIPRQKYSV